MCPASSDESVPFSLVEKALLPQLSIAARGGSPQREDRAVLAARVSDCDSQPVEGIRISLPREGVPWYFDDRSASAQLDRTSEDGLGGYFNADPGVTVVSLEGGDGFPALKLNVLLREGWMTAFRVGPAIDVAD